MAGVQAACRSQTFPAAWANQSRARRAGDDSASSKLVSDFCPFPVVQ